METLSRLPDTLREAFEMNRFEGLKYKEIAARLNVSERTVEVRIGKSLLLLRQYLKDFIEVFILLFLFG
jgi:RNA polymerase sigma-70 factor (ECF subfamily)